MLVVCSVGSAWADGYYAVTGNETFPSDESTGLVISSVEGVTLTFGPATDWKIESATVTVGNRSYTNYATTTATNPNPKDGNIPTKGDFVKFEVAKSGTITAVVQNAKDKTGYLIDENKNGLSAILTNNSNSTWISGNYINPEQGKEYSGGVQFEVTAGKTYYLYLSGSKMRFMGFEFVAAPEVEANDATLKSITVNNVAISNFDKATKEYNFELPFGTTEVPTVATIASNEKANVNITQATALPGVATIKVESEDGTANETYTVNLTVASASSEKDLLQAVFSNSFDAFIKEGKVYVYYLEGTEAPTLTSTVVSDFAKAEVIEGKLVVTAQDETTSEYDIIMEAVAPYTGNGLTFDGTESWVKNGYGFDSENNRGYRFSKTDTDWSREKSGNTRIYLFIDACESITLTTASGISSDRNIKVYRDGVLLSTPTKAQKASSNAPILIEGNPNGASMIAIVSNQTGGDGGFGAISVNKPQPITLNNNGYATYSNENTVSIEGATAYVAEVDEENSLIKLTSIGTTIPAKTGVLLVGEADATVNITLGGENVEITKNDFKAALAETETSTLGNVYVLYNEKFVKYTGETLAVNKAYIVMSDGFGLSSNAAPVKLQFGDATGINEITATAKSNNAEVIYNMNGQRVNGSAKGLLIKNGKKYIK